MNHYLLSHGISNILEYFLPYGFLLRLFFIMTHFIFIWIIWCYFRNWWVLLFHLISLMFLLSSVNAYDFLYNPQSETEVWNKNSNSWYVPNIEKCFNRSTFIWKRATFDVGHIIWLYTLLRYTSKFDVFFKLKNWNSVFHLVFKRLHLTKLCRMKNLRNSIQSEFQFFPCYTTKLNILE